MHFPGQPAAADLGESEYALGHSKDLLHLGPDCPVARSYRQPSLCRTTALLLYSFPFGLIYAILIKIYGACALLGIFD